MADKIIRIQCDSCDFWLHGDPINKASNTGLCLYMIQQKPDFYSSPEHVPFWAKELTRRTVSWEGKGCPTWKPIPEEKK